MRYFPTFFTAISVVAIVAVVSLLTPENKDAPPEQPQQSKEQNIGALIDRASLPPQQLAKLRADVIAISPEQRANFKATEIAKINFVGRHTEPKYGYTIEIDSVEKIDGGIQVFARAWKDGTQVGFGKDGTIETERFRIFNPPIMVHDPAGGVVIEEFNDIRNSTTTTRLSVNPFAAILETLGHNIKVTGTIGGPIVPGSRGNTVTTLFTDSSNEDGQVQQGDAAVSWATIRGGTGWLATDNQATNYCGILLSLGTANTWNYLYRGITIFDTSSIPDTDVISSATWSIYSSSADVTDPFSDSISLVSSAPASNTSLAAGDYDSLGETKYADSITLATWHLAEAYQDFALNATGLAAIDVAGRTYFGTRLESDRSNTEPTWASAGGAGHCYYNEQTGTSQDPKLVIVHSAPVTASPEMPIPIWINNGSIQIDNGGIILQ